MFRRRRRRARSTLRRPPRRPPGNTTRHHECLRRHFLSLTRHRGSLTRHRGSLTQPFAPMTRRLPLAWSHYRRRRRRTHPRVIFTRLRACLTPRHASLTPCRGRRVPKPIILQRHLHVSGMS